MKNQPLILGNTYHYFNRGNNKVKIFYENENYLYFLRLLKKYILPIAEIYAYCLMSNHFHLLFKLKEEENFPEKYIKKPHLPFANLFNAYTKSINKVYDRSGSLFQKHPKKILIEDDTAFLNTLLYIHLNPVKHQYVTDFTSYKYSSYSAYFSKKPTSLNTERVLDEMELDNFEFLHKEKQALILGADAFET